MQVGKLLGLLGTFVLSNLATSNITSNEFYKLLISTALTLYANKTIFRTIEKRKKLDAYSSSLANGAFPRQCRVAPPIINAVLYCKRAPNLHVLKAALEEHLLKYNRFTSINVVGADGNLVLQPVTVDLSRHIYVHNVEDNLDAHRKLTSISAFGDMFNPHAPRWEFHLIKNKRGEVHETFDLDAINPANVDVDIKHTKYNYVDNTTRENYTPITQDETHMIMIRICHSIGDGIAIMNAFVQFVNDAKTGKPLRDLTAKFAPRKTEKASPITTAVKAVGSLVKIMGLAVGPHDTPTLLSPKLKVRNMGEKDLPDHKSWTTFKNSRDLIMVPPIDLQMVKDLKNAAGVTVNDVCMAVLAGAVRRYCVENDDKAVTSANGSNTKANGGAGEVLYRALLPVAFPRTSESLSNPATALINRWAFLSVPLPVGLSSSKPRLQFIKTLMSALKQSPEAFVSLKLTGIVNKFVPTMIARSTAADLFTRHSMVFSNVPGPDHTAMFANEEIVALQMVFPNLIPQVGMLSYSGKIYMNFCLDTNDVPNAFSLPSHVIAELQQLCKDYNVKWRDGVANTNVVLEGTESPKKAVVGVEDNIYLAHTDDVDADLGEDGDEGPDANTNIVSPIQ